MSAEKRSPFLLAILLLSLCQGSLYAGVNIWTCNGPDGGYVSSLVIDPKNPSILYTGTGIGIYKSLNGGATWSAINQGLERKSGGAIAIDPRNSSTLYAVSGGKLYKSSDGGGNWNALADISPSRIVIDPSNPAIMYATVGSSIKKSIDGGSSWAQILTSTYGQPGGMMCLLLDPAHPETIYAGESANYYDSSGCLHKSLDGGKTWTVIMGKNIYCLAIDPQAPNTIYAGATAYGHHGARLFPGGLFKSLDGGTTWAEIIQGTTASAFWDIELHPQNPDEVYVISGSSLIKSTDGGIHWQEIAQGLSSVIIDPLTPATFYGTGTYGLLKSVDQGAHWAEINANIHNAAVKALAVDPSDPIRIYACAYRGGRFYASPNEGATWQTRGTIPADFIYTLSVDPAAPSILYAGGEGGVFKSTDSGWTWNSVSDGLPSANDASFISILIDPANHLTLFAAQWYGSIYKSIDGGAHWNSIGSFDTHYIVSDPSAADVLYAGGDNGLYKSLDGGSKWTRICTLQGSAFAVDPAHPSVLYLGGHPYLYRSEDGGLTWSILKIFQGYQQNFIIIHPLRPSIIYTFDSDVGISISVNGGKDWGTFTEGLNVSGQVLAIDPRHPERLYLSTNGGGVYSFDFDATAYPAGITLSRKALIFGGTTKGPTTGSQQVVVGNSGAGDMNWTATPSDAWIVVQPSSGTNTGVINISVNPSSLPYGGIYAGQSGGSVTVSSPNAINNPQTIGVTFNIYEDILSHYIYGYIDTPLDRATNLAGAIPVSGWALDLIEVAKVEIWRDSVAGETPGQWYIGDAVFVEGARPDIEAAYPKFPLNSRAGWGYMLLTNMLPGQGNGTYKLYAYATDKRGYRQRLEGTKTITCDNAHAVKPFGAIDTPAQGGDASGTAFLNFGWVLAPQPHEVPKDGSTISVWVDGVELGHPIYDQYRKDVADAFPGLKNSAGPVGYYYFDTTKYADGVHAIWWTAEDQAGNADGIGSRYFTILNTGTSAPDGREETASFSLSRQGGLRPAAGQVVPRRNDIDGIPISSGLIWMRKGFLAAEPFTTSISDDSGIHRIEINEVQRIEIALNGDPGESAGRGEKQRRITISATPSRYSGYLVVGDELRPLPIGSTLDEAIGIFSWMPGPGFLGTYDLVFLIQDPYGTINRTFVQVVIKPKLFLR